MRKGKEGYANSRLLAESDFLIRPQRGSIGREGKNMDARLSDFQEMEGD